MVLPSSFDGTISVAIVSVILLLAAPASMTDADDVGVFVALKLVASGWFTTTVIVPLIL
jgi:hypothetical protein